MTGINTVRSGCIGFGPPGRKSNFNLFFYIFHLLCRTVVDTVPIAYRYPFVILAYFSITEMVQLMVGGFLVWIQSGKVFSHRLR